MYKVYLRFFHHLGASFNFVLAKLFPLLLLCDVLLVFWNAMPNVEIRNLSRPSNCRDHVIVFALPVRCSVNTDTAFSYERIQ
jgi:hypothetical protein